MNDIETNYRAAASAYQEQRQNYLHAGRCRRMRTISNDDYIRVHDTHQHLQRVLDHAEAAWIASWS